MRALTISAHGDLSQLELREVPVPDLVGPHDVRVRLHAAALNRLDLWVLGGIPGVRITPPWVVGSDGAGVVEVVGTAVTRVRPGDRVILNPGVVDRTCTCEYCRDGDQPLCLGYGVLGEHRPGTLAEYVVVPDANLECIPDDLPWHVAAAFPLATLTAWRMVVGRARVQAGDHVLIWGIGGGVALAALQICKRIGATVWVTSGSDAKLARAQALGADHLLNHAAGDAGTQARRATHKRGMDVVIDSVGEATWTQSLIALGKRGRLVTCGGTSGPMVQTDVRRMFWNQWTLMGSTMGSDAEFAAIAAELRAGRLRPPVDSVYSLEAATEAYRRLGSGAQFGKVVVAIAPG
jgi:NADPH:quinone reductase-like Zn-dependent oxidoreductase